MNTPSLGVKLLSTGMAVMLLVAGALVFSVGISLFLLTERTDRYFAWTVRNPLMAATLGAGYWASCSLEFLAARERVWARARVAVPAVLVFTSLTLIVTLVHREAFHFDSPRFVTWAGTWVWLGVYAIVPVVMGALLVVQLRAPGVDPARVAPLPAWVRGVMLTHALVMAVLGVVLMLWPSAGIDIWPWTLTTLTSRALGAWLLGLSVAAAQMAWENDWWRIPVGLIGYAILGLLELIALARYAERMDWSNPGAWVYVSFLASFIVIAVYGWAPSRQANRQADSRGRLDPVRRGG